MSSILTSRPLFLLMKDLGNYLGRTSNGDAMSGEERSTLVLGPSRSGKTSSIIIPNLLMTRRAVVTTSTKDDVVQTMASATSNRATLLFDPSGTVRVPRGVHRVGYSSIRQGKTWDGAVLATRTMTDVARRNRVDRSDDHWTERASTLVAPLLHAAALNDITMPALSSRVDLRQASDALEDLTRQYGEHHPSVTSLQGVLATEERELSGVWSTASGLFAGLRTEAARQASREAPLDVAEFLKGRHHLHIVAPSRHQAVTVPLVVGLIDELVHATYDRHHEGAQLLLALDELANVAPLPQLASIVSEGGGQGVLTLACLQDLSQARGRWGANADGFLSLFPTTVVLPGIADNFTLEMFASLAGREYVSSPVLQRNARGAASGSSFSWNERERVTNAELAHGRPGFALGLDATKQLRWIALTPAHRDERFRGHLERSPYERSRDRAR